MSFSLRWLDLPSFGALERALDRAAKGDRGVLSEWIKRGRARLDDPGLGNRHEIASWLVPAWRERLNELEAMDLDGEERARDLARILIPLECMPEFQYAKAAAPSPSPALVVLGEDDGGLYGALRDADPWFDQLFLERFESATTRYASDDAMILLDRADRQRLLELVTRHEDLGASPAARRERARLAHLLEQSLKDEALTIAVCVRAH